MFETLVFRRLTQCRVWSWRVGGFLLQPQMLEQLKNGVTDNFKTQISRVSNDRLKAEIRFLGTTYTFFLRHKPANKLMFEHPLAQPNTEALGPLVETHRTHIIASCVVPSDKMEVRVRGAAGLHYLAAKLGGFCDPVAGFWADSGQIRAWQAFSLAAERARDVLATGRTDMAPTRFWVSVQLLRKGNLFGGVTEGLSPFVGYELELEPLGWSMEPVAERLVDTVSYLFRHGDVLRDGETLGPMRASTFELAVCQKPTS